MQFITHYVLVAIRNFLNFFLRKKLYPIIFEYFFWSLDFCQIREEMRFSFKTCWQGFFVFRTSLAANPAPSPWCVSSSNASDSWPPENAKFFTRNTSQFANWFFSISSNAKSSDGTSRSTLLLQEDFSSKRIMGLDLCFGIRIVLKCQNLIQVLRDGYIHFRMVSLLPSRFHLVALDL